MFAKKTVLKITITDDKISMRKCGRRKAKYKDLLDSIKLLADTVEGVIGTPAPAILAMLSFDYLQ